MLLIVTSVFLLLLFTLLFLFLRYALFLFVKQRKARVRLQYMREAKLKHRISAYLSKYDAIHHHLSELLESIESRMTIGGIVTASFVLSLIGLITGAYFFQNVKGMLSFTAILGSLPYAILRMRLLSVRLQTRLEFLPAVEVFYQYYLICGQKNIKAALKMCLEEQRIQYPMKPVFEQLYRNLMTQRSIEQSLRVFSLTLGHIWAEYLTGIIRVALTEGIDVSENLKDLVLDMHRAQRFDQVERNRLLEIRIANFTPIFFLILFLSVNFKMNYVNSYHYYLLDPEGRNLLLDAVLLIFLSFIMGIVLSFRRM
jgi:hypothetical protein